MSSRESSLAAELRPTLALAGPIVIGQVGIMLMGIVDTAMVGGLGPHAVAAVGVGSSLFGAVFVSGLGLLLGIDRVASVAFGARRIEECHRVLLQGSCIAAASGGLLTLLLFGLATHLGAFHIAPDLVPDAAAYLRVLALSLVPTLLFSVLRQTLQAMGEALAPTAVLLAANVVNLVGNQVLIHGLGHFQGLGVVGSAWSTVAARVFMALALGVHAWQRGLIGARSQASLEWHGATMGELLRLGVPAAGQMLLEVGFFSSATVIIAGLGDVPAAAHQIVLVTVSCTFMVPLGVSSAGAVRVGHALGRGDTPGAARAGWAAVALGVSFMAGSAVMLLAASTPILHVFTRDVPTVALARRLLVCAALFQISDGSQVTFGGALRGIGDTLNPLLANLAGHWLIGFPVALWLCFRAGMGAEGVWIGLATGLSAVALTLLGVWRRRIARLVGDAPVATEAA